MDSRWEAEAAGPGSRFLDPRVLQRIGNLELVAKHVVEGFLHGLHRSPFLGQSLDFAEHRQYTPGDDLRRVDWKVFARTDRYYVKEFEAETNANLTVLLDRSRSMGFGTTPVEKFDQARFLAASLAFLARRQGDRVGLMTFDREVRDVVPCSARHLDLVLLAMDRSRPERTGDLAGALGDLTGRQRRRGILLLVSDLYVDPEVLGRAAGRLRTEGNDLIVFQVLDPAERTFPYTGSLDVEDMETGARIPVTPDELRGEYRTLVEEHVQEVSRVLAAAGADHAVVEAGEPLGRTLHRYLAARQERRRRGTWASPS